MQQMPPKVTFTKRDPQAAGKEFFTSVLAKVPEAKRAQVQQLMIDDPEIAKIFLPEIGAGHLKQEEFNRYMNEVAAVESHTQTEYEKLVAWRAEQQKAIEEGEAAKAKVRELEAASRGNGNGNGNGTGDPPPAFDPTKYLTTEDADKRAAALVATELARKEAEFLNLMTVKDKIVSHHMEKFGKYPDMEAIFKYAHEHAREQVTLVDAYNAVYADQYKTAAEKEQEAHDQKIRDEAVDKYRREHPELPYVTGNGPRPTSTLDTLETQLATGKAPDLSQFTVDRAVQQFNEAQGRALGQKPAGT